MNKRAWSLNWIAIAAMGFGGGNQSMYLIDSLTGGQGGIAAQGSASLLLLAGGFILVCLAAPGWLELVLMSPGSVGGIGAACGVAFRPYSPMAGAIAGLSNWWGWTATLGLGSTTIAGILGPVFFPAVPVWVLAAGILLTLFALALCGLRVASTAAMVVSAAVSFLVVIAILSPVLGGNVNISNMTEIKLATPFPGVFGQISALMAGLYQVGYGAPAVEGALSLVGESRSPVQDTRRALLTVIGIGAVFYLVLPSLWFSAVGGAGLSVSMDRALGPVFAPLLGPAAKAAAIGLVALCWTQTALLSLTGPPRTLVQLSLDGMAPRFLARRTRRQVPQAAILVTAAGASMFVLINDPVFLQGSANFAYLIGIFLPSVAVWLLRRDDPDLARPWRAPQLLINLGMFAGLIWFAAGILGFEQFGLRYVLIGLVMTYTGAVVFTLRKLEDRVQEGKRGFRRTLYIDVTVPLLVVLALDAAGYLVALNRISGEDPARVAGLQDIFLAVAIFSLSVGIALPGRIAFIAEQISVAASRLSDHTFRQFTRALDALGRGDLDAAHLDVDVVPIPMGPGNELGTIGASFNAIQDDVKKAAVGLENARQGLLAARNSLTTSNLELQRRVSDQERLTHELTAARDAAQAGERSKAEFLAMISHELRTPLNGVIGMAGLLLDGNMDEQSRLYAKTLRDAGDHLLGVINDLLDFSKLEAGRLEFEESPFEIDGVTQSSLELVAPRAYAKNIELGAYVSPDIPPVLVGDAGRLRQILINLLGNAIKFTTEGSVVLEVVLRDQDESGLVLGFSITDTGIGIHERDIPNLFQEFRQVDSSVSRRFGGTGLGLAISRLLVEQMGGHIEVESTLGTGSTFRFTAKLKAGTFDKDEQPRGLARLEGERILVYAKHDQMGRLFTRQIRSRGGIVHRAANVGAALNLIRQASEANRPFRAILVELDAPDAQFRDLCGQLRGDVSGADVRLVLVSSPDASRDLSDLDKARVAAWLIKPVPTDTLMYRLKDDDRHERDKDTRDSAPALPKANGIRILVAEDNPTNQAVIRALLGKLGYRPDFVANGLEAVDAVRERPYDLVLMDVMMPEMDGIAATRAIRQLEGKAGLIPIFALTADASPDRHVAYRAAGIQHVLVKPISLASLEHALVNLPVSKV